MSTLGKRIIFVGPADGSNHKPLNVEGVATEAGILPGTDRWGNQASSHLLTTLTRGRMTGRLVPLRINFEVQHELCS